MKIPSTKEEMAKLVKGMLAIAECDNPRSFDSFMGFHTSVELDNSYDELGQAFWPFHGTEWCCSVEDLLEHTATALHMNSVQGLYGNGLTFEIDWYRTAGLVVKVRNEKNPGNLKFSRDIPVRVSEKGWYIRATDSESWR